MILLLSAGSDTNMDFIVNWLRHFNHPFLRINADDVLEGDFDLAVAEKRLVIKGKTIDLDSVKAVWYRKFGGFSRSGFFHRVKDAIGHSDLQQLANEYNSILGGIVAMLQGKNWLTPPWVAGVNKLDMLSLAATHGLKTPRTWVVSTRKKVQEILADGTKLISKSVYEPYFIQDSKGYYSMFTKGVKEETDMPEHFFPSLVQEKVPKAYELRVFYLDGAFYTMAIFSQSSKLSEMDFRRFDFTSPARRVPYELPPEVKEGLHSMLGQMGLNCCSVDLIKSSEDGEYYFLEVNPTGEFGMTAIPCNYPLYQKIAQKLIQMDQSDENI